MPAFKPAFLYSTIWRIRHSLKMLCIFKPVSECLTFPWAECRFNTRKKYEEHAMKVLFIEYKNFGTEDAADAFKNLGITPVIWSTPLVRERVSSEFDQTFEQYVS